MIKTKMVVSCGDYSIVQVLNGNYYSHYYYKAGKPMLCKSSSACIPRSTKKQLYRYLRYLVNTGIIAMFNEYSFNNQRYYAPNAFDEVYCKIDYYEDSKKTNEHRLKHSKNDNGFLYIRDCKEEDL